MHTNLLSEQQIYAGDSLKENGIFNFSFEWITKPHVNIPSITHDEDSIVYDKYSCKNKVQSFFASNLCCKDHI